MLALAVACRRPPRITQLTRAQFIQHFPRLVLEARDLPKKAFLLNVLLVSVICGLEPGRPYAEAEINAGLQAWLLRFATPFGLDHARLRRMLVDAGYLRRDAGGAAYQSQPQGRTVAYDPAIRELDMEALVAEGRLRREERKRAFAPKSGR
jgi:hypothetical protein